MRNLTHTRLFSCLVIMLIGCGKEPTPKADLLTDPKETPRAEVTIGGSGEDDGRRLSFKITEIYEKQQPSKVAPFYVNGGEWTFFNCRAELDAKVEFTVGVLSKSPGGDLPMAWGRAILIVKDQEAGGRFVEQFGKSFPGKMPMLIKHDYSPGPLFINTAVFGSDFHRQDKGGFSGNQGRWMATKWFPEFDGSSGEVYFNYNLDGRQGEFSEKDPDYADDLLTIFAAALRDGPRPERTPENDPNLTRTGPTIGLPRKLLPRISGHYLFTPNSRFAVFDDKTSILALPIDNSDGKPFEIATFENTPWDIRVLDDDLNLVVQEGIPEDPRGRSSSDPMRVFWVDGKTKEKKLLRGPEKGLNLAEEPVSPDHRYIALHQWRDIPGKKGRKTFLLILDRERGTITEFELQVQNLSLVTWKDTEAGFRAVTMTHRWRFNDKEVSELYLADTTTGKLERQENADARLEIDNPLSPDKKYRFRLGKDELIVTNVADGTGHPFVLHEDDRRFVGDECVEWVSPRYLRFNGQRLALIDVTTMKMSFPMSADQTNVGSHSYKFSSDFRWVLYQGEGADGEGLYLSPIEMPKEQ